MLDVMRKHSRSFIIYVFFGIIIAVFVINFGPQSAGCTAGTSHAARVEGRSISQALFNFALQVAGFRTEHIAEREMVQIRAIVMDQLLVRELLADDALKQGFRISDKEIDDMIVRGRFLALGQPHPMPRNDEGKFDYDLFSRYVRFSWGLNVMKFKEEQRRELLAEKMKQYLAGLVKTSEDEVSADFMVRNTQVDLNYVRFSPAEYRSKVPLEEGKVKAWLAANKKRVEDYYKDNLAAFQKLPKQVRLEVIQVNGKTIKAAHAKAEGLLKRIKGGEPFAKVAAAESDDAESRGAGGLLGWRNEDSPGFEPAVAKAITGLKKDELSGVLDGKESAFLVKVVNRRSGDLSMAQAEQDIAEELYQTDEAIRLAKTDAEAFVKRAKGGEKLTAMFTADEDKKEEDEEGKAEEPASKPAAKSGEGRRGAAKGATDEAPKAKSPLKLATTGFFSRSGRALVPGIGVSKEVMAASFKLRKGQVADQPFVVGQMVYLVGSADRKEADAAEWARRRNEITDEFTQQKASRVIREYARQRCEAALRNKDIHVNPGALVTPGYMPDKKEGPLPNFAPCSSLQERAQ
jgi:parvulin-like peptidyl-prolyl isomerase